MTEKITKDMTIENIFQSFPEKQEELSEFLMSIGLGCIGCAAAQMETLEEGLLNHGFEEEKINQIFNSLNSIISN